MARTPQPECRPRRQPSPLRQPLTASTQTVTRPDSAPCVVSQLETSTLTGGVWIRNWVGGPWCDGGTGVSVCGGGADRDSQDVEPVAPGVPSVGRHMDPMTWGSQP